MDGFDGMPGRSAPRDGTAPGDGSASARGRDSLFLIASLRLGDDPHVQDVRIRNLSAGGMMAELAARVAVGTAAFLDLRGIGRVSGRIAWCTQGRVGIALDHPIDPKRARKTVGGGTKTPFYAKSAPR